MRSAIKDCKYFSITLLKTKFISENMLRIATLSFFIAKCVIVHSSSQDVEFDKQYVGVVFEPYTKFGLDKRDYMIEDVENMLEIVTKHFRWFSTYTMGTTSPTEKWNTGEAGGLTPVAASNINSKMQELKLIGNIGIWHDLNDPNDRIMHQKIGNAITASELANNNFPGTINGVIITSDKTGSDGQLQSILNLVKAHVTPRARNLSLKVGIRSANCDILSTALSNVASPFHQPVLRMVEELDFINCMRLPESPNLATAIDWLSNYFLQARQGFSINPNFTVIAQTGWPSYDQINEKYSSDISIQFWKEMAQWAKHHQFRLDMFQAFDEPWKSSRGTHEPHFGWWKRVKNDSNGVDAFQEKKDYVEPIVYDDHTLEIVLGVVGSVVFLIMLGGIIYLYKTLVLVKKQVLSQRDIDEFKHGIKSDMALDDNVEDALRLPYDRSYEIPRRQLSIDTSKLLGSGNFGCVYKGKVEGQDDDVALKLTQTNCTSTTLKSLLSEIKIMIHVGKHPNVVSIVGACTADIKKGSIMIAIELCVGGSLEKRLRSYKEMLTRQESSDSFVTANEDGVRYVNTTVNKPSAVTRADVLEKCVRWSYEIACGMQHIASRNVIHADLAARNILLTAGGSAKITDFGLSRRLYEYTNYVKQNQEPLPWRWMSIESLSTLTFSTASDIWSYGVTLFEIFSLGDIPYPGMSWSVDFVNDLENGLRMNKPNLATDQVYSMMSNCWNLVPGQRPSFTDLASFFQNVLTGPSQNLEYDNEEGSKDIKYLLQDED